VTPADLVQRRVEAAAGAVLALAGGYFTAASWRLGAGPDPSAPGPGAMPGLIGLGLILCGGAIAAAALFKLFKAPAISIGAGATPDQNNHKLVVAIVMLLAGALLLEPLGFMLSTFLFLITGFVVLGGASWRRALPAAALVSTSLWLFFTKLLGVGLPFGRIVEILLY
jgi:putative tricarboxylic transport membrane protein